MARLYRADVFLFRSSVLSPSSFVLGSALGMNHGVLDGIQTLSADDCHCCFEDVSALSLQESTAADFSVTFQLRSDGPWAHSENAEYHMAKQRQEFVKARLRQLGKRIADLSLINMDNIPRDKVGLGSTVRVHDNDKNEEVEYKLVTSEEADFPAGKISTSSPIGRALLNKKVGDTAIVVTPNGKREMEILKLSTIHDEAAAG